MVYKLVDYSKLKDGVCIAIKNLFKHHRVELSNSDKVDIPDLIKLISVKEERGLQALFLHLVFKQLEYYDADDKIKAMVLTAACYHVIESIRGTYRIFSPKPSTLFSSLTSLLNFPDDTFKIQPADQVNPFIQLERFIRQNLYEGGNPDKGYLTDNPFVIHDAPKFSILAILVTVVEKNKALQVKGIKSLESQQKTKDKPSGGYFFGWGSGSKKSSEDERPGHSFK